MNLKSTLAALLAVGAAACGSDDTKTFTITSGTYALTANATASGADECDMASVYTLGSPPIAINVSGATASFDLNPVSPANEQVVTTITGNAIANTTAANFTVAVASTTCQYTQNVTVSGDITANNEVAVNVVYTKTQNQGFTCTALNVGATTFTNGRCTSSIHILARRQ